MELVILIAVVSIAMSVVYTVSYGKIIKAMNNFDEEIENMLVRLAE